MKSDIDVVDSFVGFCRCVCGKLYFKAEAQEIDRILQAFAHRYWYCNKHSKLLYNAGTVHLKERRL
jgi:Sec7-like guanine-nucleotide exchange factor